MRSYLIGYVGTNTVPNCERGVCWYFVKDVFPISAAQLKKLQVPDVVSNNRKTHAHMGSYKQYDAPGLLYKAPAN